ncbi:MAG TPA: carbon storage regulator CsrA [Pirellulales bacterium]
MLVLTRKSGDQVLIGEDVVLTVVEVRGDRIKIGIAAPVETPVHRDEVYQRIHAAPPAEAKPAE